jgi:imidazolonepropionase-like amidohydrolase
VRIYKAEVLIDGNGAEPQRDVEILVDDGGIIRDIAPSGTNARPPDASEFSRPGTTVLPGFIDVHVHLMFGEKGRSYRDVWHNDPDTLMVLRGPRNAYSHLRAGVTTLRDAGAVRNVAFSIKRGAQANLFLAPRILVSGRPVTATGGHFWWCGQEADGEDGIRSAVRRLVKDGADFIKIMASGGGTVGTEGARPSYSLEELRTAVKEAHQCGKRTFAHCIAAESVRRAALAGVDEIEHFNFLHPDGRRTWDQETAEIILKNGQFVSPTIQTGWRKIEQLRRKQEEASLSPEEEQWLNAALYKTETKLEFVGRFHEMGVPIVAGTDSITQFGDYALGLELLHRAGLSPMEVIMSATSLAAQALGMESQIGVLRPGMLADLVYVEGNPLRRLEALSEVVAVVSNGNLVVDKWLETKVCSPGMSENGFQLMPLAVH